jgi:hypothetical protein
VHEPGFGTPDARELNLRSQSGRSGLVRRERIDSAKMIDTVEKVSAKKLWNWNLKRWSASGSLELENSDGRARNEIRLRYLRFGCQPLATHAHFPQFP